MKPVHRNESDDHCKCNPSDTRLSILVNVKYYCLGCITTTTSKHPAQSLACLEYMHTHTRTCIINTLYLPSVSLSLSQTHTYAHTQVHALTHTPPLPLCIYVHVCVFVSLSEPAKQNNINSLYV